MALNAYLTLVGVKSGKIEGSVTQKGRERSIAVIATSHEISSPRDAASGMASGKRIHKPFVITKEIDKSTPKLLNVLVTNENLEEWTLKYWRPSVSGPGAGVEQQHYTVKLTDASISSIRQVMPNNKNPELQRYETYEEVSFVYGQIEWTWVDGGISTVDSWESSGIV